MSKKASNKKKTELKNENSLNVVCIVSSVRESRLANRMIKLVENEFEEILKPKGHVLEIIDPQQYDLPLLKQPLHFYPDQTKAPASLRNLNAKASGADAYIILTAEYNKCLPPALTNLLDHLPPASFEYKPSGLIGYSIGSLGGAIACNAARPFLSEIGCIPVKHITTIANAHKEVDEEGNTENERITKSIKKLLEQLEWWGRATKKLRDAEGVPE